MKKIFCNAAICVSIFCAAFCAACAGTPAGGDAAETALFEYEMISVKGAEVNASIGTSGDHGGAFSNAAAKPVTVADFNIGKTEVPYALWYEVRVWAEAKGYRFANKGKEGRDGTSGRPTGRKLHPVTNASFRDMVVWCNAYSEKTGKTPVYYEDAGCTKVLKAAQTKAEADAETGTAELATLKKDADGYRLPTEAEWEFAARGGDPADVNNWTMTYAGGIDPDTVAWYGPNSGDSTHPVAQKAPNSLGLYDMSGNVYERVQNPKIIKAGAYHNPSETNVMVDYKTNTSAFAANNTAGFRLASN